VDSKDFFLYLYLKHFRRPEVPQNAYQNDAGTVVGPTSTTKKEVNQNENRERVSRSPKKSITWP
jgi:hypothetical protein